MLFHIKTESEKKTHKMGFTEKFKHLFFVRITFEAHRISIELSCYKAFAVVAMNF